MPWPLFRTLTEFVQALDVRTPLPSERVIIKSAQDGELTTLGYDELEGYIDPVYPQWPDGGYPPGSWPGGPDYGYPGWGSPTFPPPVFPGGDGDTGGGAGDGWGADPVPTDPVEAYYRPIIAGTKFGASAKYYWEDTYFSNASFSVGETQRSIIPIWPAASSTLANLVLEAPSSVSPESGTIRIAVGVRSVSTGLVPAATPAGAVHVTLTTGTTNQLIVVPLPPLPLAAGQLNLLDIRREAVSGDLAKALTIRGVALGGAPGKHVLGPGALNSGGGSGVFASADDHVVAQVFEIGSSFITSYSPLPESLSDGTHTLTGYFTATPSTTAGTQLVSFGTIPVSAGALPAVVGLTGVNVPTPGAGAGAYASIYTYSLGSFTKSGPTLLAIRQGPSALRPIAALAFVID